MLWDSAWLQGLAVSETPEQRALMRIALTPQDNIVFSQRAQTLPGVTPVVFDGLGHVQMCSAPEVIERIANELNSPPLAATPTRNIRKPPPYENS